MKYRRLLILVPASIVLLLALATGKEPQKTVKETKAALSGLAVSDGTLEPAFSKDVTAYELVVKHAISAVTVTPAARDGATIITVDGARCVSGKPSAPVALADGKNPIRVSASGNGEKTYEITIIRMSEIPKITLDFSYGVDGASSYGNIYAAWIEDLSGNVIQNLAVCNRLVGVGGPLTNTALPFWKTKRYDAGQVDADAVTGATKAKQNFTVEAALKDPTVTAFKVCFETDRSYDANDWFTDQPALLYSATVDLGSPRHSYALELEAWTANEGTMSSLKEWLGTLSVGSKQTELRFITNDKDTKSADKPPFGKAAPDTSATCFVRGITLAVE